MTRSEDNATGSRSPRFRNVAHRLLGSISTGQGILWTMERASQVAGPDVSAATCRRALEHLQELGAISLERFGVPSRNVGCPPRDERLARLGVTFRF